MHETSARVGFFATDVLPRSDGLHRALTYRAMPVDLDPTGHRAGAAGARMTSCDTWKQSMQHRAGGAVSDEVGNQRSLLVDMAQRPQVLRRAAGYRSGATAALTHAAQAPGLGRGKRAQAGDHRHCAAGAVVETLASSSWARPATTTLPPTPDRRRSVYHARPRRCHGELSAPGVPEGPQSVRLLQA
jgi:hypothetical protein